MVNRGEFSYDPANLTVEAMQEALFERGWEYSVYEYDSGEFSRSYARINPVLQSDEWRSVIGEFPSLLDERAPYLSRGLGIGTARKETEIELEISGNRESRDLVTKVYMLDEHLRESGFEDVDEAMLDAWLKLKGEPGAPRIGSKEYYEQSLRAAELRNLSLEVIDHYRQVVMSEGVDGEAMAKLLELNKKLAELAIEPNMHVGAPQVEFVDPVVRVEWVAGLLREALQQGYGFSGNARAMIEEHNLLCGTKDIRLAVVGSDSPGGDAASILMNLGSLAEHLDPEPEED